MALKIVCNHLLDSTLIIVALINFAWSLPTLSQFGPGSKGSHLAIDIESCTCTPMTKICEVTISSSIFGGNHCADQQHLCCSVTKKSEAVPPETKTSNNNRNSTTNNSSSGGTKIKIVVPTAAPASSFSVRSNQTDKPRIRCRCNLREKCPEIYTDYSFGFHCSYDKVRCCEPVDGDEPETEITAKNSGRLINVLSATATEKMKETCRCLPEARCNISPEKITKRKDTACPDNLIQCCGEMILAEKKSDDVLLLDEEPLEKISKGFSQPPKTELSGALQEGHSAHHQPVQIPLLKIPSEETQATVPPSTLPPPTLPNQYYYPPQTPYHHRYVYTPVTPRVQPAQYFVSGDPSSHRYSDTYLVNHNGRGFKVPGRSSSGSLLSNLASLLG